MFVLACSSHAHPPVIANRAPPPAPAAAGACAQGKQLPAASSTHGDLDKNLLRHTIQAHRAELSACYAAYLERGDLAGRLTARFTVGGEGRVQDALVTGFDDELDTCVCNVFARLAFLPGPAPFTVTYPIVFSPLP